MKIGLIVVNAILFVAVAILFYLHFNSTKTDSYNDPDSRVSNAGSSSSDSSNNFKIAYFEMDEIEEKFQMIKDFKDSMRMKEDYMNNELDKMEKEYQKQYNEYLLKDGTITQAHQQTLIDLSDKMKDREKLLKLEKEDFSRTEQMKMKSLLENVIQQLNKDNKYSFIMSYEPGFMYYKDSRYDITADVLKGLNKMYKKKKP
jgi:outer membrane protein